MLKREVTAGTEERGDVRVTVSPCLSGRSIKIEKLPHPRFRTAILEISNQILDEEQADYVQVQISDFGALDFVLEARLRAAIREARRDTTC